MELVSDLWRNIPDRQAILLGALLQSVGLVLAAVLASWTSLAIWRNQRRAEQQREQDRLTKEARRHREQMHKRARDLLLALYVEVTTEREYLARFGDRERRRFYTRKMLKGDRIISAGSSRMFGSKDLVTIFELLELDGVGMSADDVRTLVEFFKLNEVLDASYRFGLSDAYAALDHSRKIRYVLKLGLLSAKVSRQADAAHRRLADVLKDNGVDLGGAAQAGPGEATAKDTPARLDDDDGTLHERPPSAFANTYTKLIEFQSLRPLRTQTASRKS